MAGSAADHEKDIKGGKAMKQRCLSALLAAVMLLSLLAGCAP